MKKKNITITSLLLIFSFLISAGSALALDPSPISKETGHRFIEEMWGINYDVLSGKLVEDYTPGPYASELNDTGDDPTPEIDANYYIAYINLGQVQTTFMALESYTLYGEHANFTGCAPYQIMQQHFRTPSGAHVIVQNSFAGLVAYQENDVVNGVPDKNDSLYYGDSLHSQYHKYLFNNRLAWSLGGIRPINETIKMKATPVIPLRSEDGDEVSYKFGMNYENLFIVWHDMNEDADFGAITNATDLIGKAVAFTSLAYLNFTYEITGTLVEDKPVNITTTTEYDIGPITDLWIINDDETYTNSIGGEFYDLLWTERDISRYNTSAAIEDRLDGDETHLGFGLAVTNYARIAVIAATVEEQDGSEILDDNNETVDGAIADYNVTRLDLRTGNRPSFGIDFASKPNYTLDGDEENQMFAPVKLYPSVRLKAHAINRIDGLAVHFLNSINKAMIQWRLDYANEKYDLEGKKIEINVAKRNVLYAICFPEWSGKSIYQDPTFTAYADPSRSGLLSRIDGYTPFIIGLLSIITTSLIVRKYKKNI